MSDVVAFLRARLDEAEQVAKAAASTSRSTDRMRGAYSRWDTDRYYSDDDEPYAVLLQGSPRQPCVLGQFVPEAIPARLAAHIALNDPAYVLADIAAKRRILDDLLITEDRSIEPAAWVIAKGILHLLALPYAAHPDYDPAWAPS